MAGWRAERLGLGEGLAGLRLRRQWVGRGRSGKLGYPSLHSIGQWLSILSIDKVGVSSQHRDIRAGRIDPWFLCDDFNLVYKAKGKNNLRLNT
jgi:hypothetical protein